MIREKDRELKYWLNHYTCGIDYRTVASLKSDQLNALIINGDVLLQDAKFEVEWEQIRYAENLRWEEKNKLLFKLIPNSHWGVSIVMNAPPAEVMLLAHWVNCIERRPFDWPTEHRTDTMYASRFR